MNVASLDDFGYQAKSPLTGIEAKASKDIAAMLKAGASLARGLAGASEMFRGAFQPSESLKALVYFNVRDLPSVSRIYELSIPKNTH